MTGIATPQEGALVDSGRSFFNGSSGRWAGEQLMRALKAGQDISPAALRTLDLLRRDEWIFFDEQLVSEAQIRLRGVADLMSAGLTRTIANGLAKTLLQWENVTDMEPATVSLDGVTRSENDRVEFSAASLPLPITHKDFYLNLRTILASRERGEAIDTTHIRASGRKIAEESERMLFQGGKTFMGVTVYGYTTHPRRATSGYGAGGNWAQVAKTGAEIVADVSTLVGLLEANRMYGPYGLYVSTGSSLKMSEDFKAQSDKTIRARILEIENIQFVRVVDQMPADTVVLVQMTPDVVQWVTGEPLQTVQWDVHGGFQINFKAFTIQVPLIRADAQGRSGVAHMS